MAAVCLQGAQLRSAPAAANQNLAMEVRRPRVRLAVALALERAAPEQVGAVAPKHRQVPEQNASHSVGIESAGRIRFARNHVASAPRVFRVQTDSAARRLHCSRMVKSARSRWTVLPVSACQIKSESGTATGQRVEMMSAVTLTIATAAFV